MTKTATVSDLIADLRRNADAIDVPDGVMRDAADALERLDRKCAALTYLLYGTPENPQSVHEPDGNQASTADRAGLSAPLAGGSLPNRPANSKHEEWCAFNDPGRAPCNCGAYEPQCTALGGHNWQAAEQGYEFCAVCQSYRRAVNRGGDRG